MSDKNAAGRKTEAELPDNMRSALEGTLDGLRDALARSDGTDEDGVYRYDGRGHRLRDNELHHVARLGAVSATLATAFLKVRAALVEKTGAK